VHLDAKGEDEPALAHARGLGPLEVGELEVLQVQVLRRLLAAQVQAQPVAVRRATRQLRAMFPQLDNPRHTCGPLDTPSLNYGWGHLSGFFPAGPISLTLRSNTHPANQY
jgi:hypothetical protein